MACRNSPGTALPPGSAAGAQSPAGEEAFTRNLASAAMSFVSWHSREKSPVFVKQVGNYFGNLMPVTDSIGDFLTRIRNAGRANHKTVDIPHSNMKFAIARILKDQGYVTDCEVIPGDVQDTIRITLRYYNRQPAIKEMSRVSKPGRRIYSSVDNIPRINNGLGISIISTSKGVMTDKEARKFNMGGEIICSVW